MGVRERRGEEEEIGACYYLAVRKKWVYIRKETTSGFWPLFI
jgi:hypothetical protein